MSIDPYFLHFTRRPAAVAYSWSKKKEFEPGDRMARKSALKSALQWNARNATAQLFLGNPRNRYHWVRYEDFVQEPRQVVSEIVDFVGDSVRTEELPFIDERTARIQQASHSVFGNPVRFQSGPVSIEADDKWRNSLKWSQKGVVSLLTWPLQLKYGYLW